MSFELNSAFARREERKSAHLSEVEHRDIAHALKTLAHRGLDAALGAMAQATGGTLDNAFYQCRAQNRLC